MKLKIIRKKGGKTVRIGTKFKGRETESVIDLSCKGTMLISKRLEHGPFTDDL